jgi:hypothetical protein
MSLSTTYLGIRLPHPLMVGSGPLTDDLDTVGHLGLQVNVMFGFERELRRQAPTPNRGCDRPA